MIDHSLPDWNVRRTKFRQFPQRRLFIALGYFADIVAIEGNPMSDVSAIITGVRWVMKGGRVVVDKR